jgi:hypothetical protein
MYNNGLACTGRAIDGGAAGPLDRVSGLSDSVRAAATGARIRNVRNSAEMTSLPAGGPALPGPESAPSPPAASQPCGQSHGDAEEIIFGLSGHGSGSFT